MLHKIRFLFDIVIDLFCDRKLHIRTFRSQKARLLTMLKNYHPVHYSDLFQIQKEVSPSDHFVDIGSGTGRAVFWIAYKGCIKTTGIELNEEIYSISLKNLTTYNNRHHSDITFIRDNVANLKIVNSMNVFYLYNPFNYRLFIYFLCLLQDSLKVYQRQITLILYSPQPTIIEIVKKFHFNEKSPKSTSVLGKIKPRYVIYKNS